MRHVALFATVLVFSFTVAASIKYKALWPYAFGIPLALVPQLVLAAWAPLVQVSPRELRRRGTRTDHSHAFTVRDGRYLSARWPGDAYLFAQQLLEML